MCQLEEELAEIGWHLIRRETDYAIVESEKVNSWMKLSGDRVVDWSSKSISDIINKYNDESSLPKVKSPIWEDLELGQ